MTRRATRDELKNMLDDADRVDVNANVDHGTGIEPEDIVNAIDDVVDTLTAPPGTVNGYIPTYNESTGLNDIYLNPGSFAGGVTSDELQAETDAREAADTSLNTKITSEVTTRGREDDLLRESITALTMRIDGLTFNIDYSADANFTGTLQHNGQDVVDVMELANQLSNLPNSSYRPPDELTVLLSRIVIVHGPGVVRRLHGVLRSVQVNITDQNTGAGTLYGDITANGTTITYINRNFIGWGDKKDHVGLTHTFNRIPAVNNPIFLYRNTDGNVTNLTNVGADNVVRIVNPGDTSDERKIVFSINNALVDYVPQIGDRLTIISRPRLGDEITFLTALERGGTWYQGNIVGEQTLTLGFFSGYSKFTWNSLHVHQENTVVPNLYYLNDYGRLIHHGELPNIQTDLTTAAPASIGGGVRVVGEGATELTMQGDFHWSGSNIYSIRPTLSTNNSQFATLADINSLSGNHTTRSNLMSEDDDDINTHATANLFQATDIDVPDWGDNFVLLEVDISAGLAQLITTTHDLRAISTAETGTRVNPTNSLEVIGGHLTEANGLYSLGGTGIAFGRNAAGKLMVASQISNAPISVNVYRITSAEGLTNAEVVTLIDNEIPSEQRVPDPTSIEDGYELTTSSGSAVWSAKPLQYYIGRFTLTRIQDGFDFKRGQEFVYTQDVDNPLRVRVLSSFTSDGTTAAPSSTIGETEGHFQTVWQELHPTRTTEFDDTPSSWTRNQVVLGSNDNNGNLTQISGSTTNARIYGRRAGSDRDDLARPSEFGITDTITEIQNPTNGDLIYYHPQSGWTKLDRGTDGQVLTSRTSNIEWADAATTTTTSKQIVEFVADQDIPDEAYVIHNDNLYQNTSGSVINQSVFDPTQFTLSIMGSTNASQVTVHVNTAVAGMFSVDFPSDWEQYEWMYFACQGNNDVINHTVSTRLIRLKLDNTNLSVVRAGGSTDLVFTESAGTVTMTAGGSVSIYQVIFSQKTRPPAAG